MSQGGFSEQAELRIDITDGGSAARTEALINQLMQQSLANARQLEAAMGGASASISQLGSSATGAAEKMQMLGASGVAAGEKTSFAMQQAGAAAAILGAGLLAPIKSATASFLDLDTSLRNVASIGGIADSEIGAIGKSLQTMGQSAGKSSADLANALYNVASSGYTGADAMKIVNESATAAAAGLSTTNVAAGGIVQALNAYSLSASSAKTISDQMFMTVKDGVITFEALASNIGVILPPAAASGVKFNELAAAIASMTRTNSNAAEVMTQIKDVIDQFLKPSEALSAALQKAGYESGYALLQTQGLSGAVKFLGEASGGSADKISMLLPNIRAASGAMNLLANDGKGFTDELGQMATASDGAGAKMAAFSEQTKSAQFALDQAKVAIQNAGQTAMAALAPALVAIAQGVKELAQWFGSLPQPIQTAIVAITAIGGGLLVLGGALAIVIPSVTALGGVFAAIVSPVGLAIAAIAAGAALIITNWNGIADFFKNVGGAIGDGLKNAWNTMTAWLESIPSMLFDAGSKWLGVLADGILSGLGSLGDAATQVGDFLFGWLMPQSPPKAAPWLREAGNRWIAELGKGMIDSDFSFMDELSSTLKTRFTELLGTKAGEGNIAAAVFGTQADIAAVINAFRAGATDVDALMAKVRADLQGQNGDVIELINAYLSVQKIEAQISTIQTDINVTTEQYKPLIDDAAASVEQLNSSLQLSNNRMAELKLKAMDEEDALAPYTAALNTANDDLSKAQDKYDSIKGQIEDINSLQRDQEDIINRQINALDYQANKASRGDNRTLQQVGSKITDETLAYDQQKLVLQQQYDAQRAAGDKAGMDATKAAQTALREQYDARVATLRAEQDVARDNIQKIKDANDALTQPLKDQAEDSRAAADAKLTGLYVEEQSAKLALDNATTNQANAAADLAARSEKLNAIKAEEAATQRQIDRDGLRKQLAQSQLDAVTKLRDAHIAYDNAAIEGLKKQEAPLLANLQLAKDRVAQENKVTEAINTQTQAEETAASKKAGAAGAKKTTEENRLAPLTDIQDDLEGKIKATRQRYDDMIAPLEIRLKAARAAGDDEAVKALDAGIKQLQAQADSSVSMLEARKKIIDEAVNIAKADKEANIKGLLAEAENRVAALRSSVAMFAPDSQGDKGQKVSVAQTAENVQQVINAQIAGYQSLAAAHVASVQQEQAAENQRTAMTAAMRTQFQDMKANGYDAAAALATVDNVDFQKINNALKGLGDQYASTDTVIKAVGPFAAKIGLSDQDILDLYAKSSEGGNAVVNGFVDSNGFKNKTMGKTSGAALEDAVAQAQKALGIDGKTSKLFEDMGSLVAFGFDNKFTSMPFTGPVYAAIGDMLTKTNAQLGTSGGTNSTVMSSIATSTISGYTSTITSSQAALNTAITSVLGVAMAAGLTTVNDKKNGAETVGAAVGSGIKSGLDSAVGALAQSAADAVNAILKAAKAAAKVSSPSRLFAEEIGTPIAQGIGVGITEGQPASNSAATASIDALIAIVKGRMQALRAAQTDAGMTIPQSASTSIQTATLTQQTIKVDSGLKVELIVKAEGTEFNDSAVKKITDQLQPAIERTASNITNQAMVRVGRAMYQT